MKILFSAIALAFAVPAMAQTAPATDPHAGHAQQASGQQLSGQQAQPGMDDMHKQCMEMMKQHQGKMDHGAHQGAAKSGSGAASEQGGHKGH